MTADDRPPLFARLLRLRHLRLRRWQTAIFVDATIAVAVVLVLAELATAWTLLVLPLAVALVVKLNDVVAGVLAGPAETTTAPPPEGDGAVEKTRGD